MKETFLLTLKELYYLYDVPGGSRRGGHCHMEQQEFLIALSGSFDVVLKMESLK
jgi:uncharacterized cupin superfamily protein